MQEQVEEVGELARALHGRCGGRSRRRRVWALRAETSPVAGGEAGAGAVRPGAGGASAVGAGAGAVGRGPVGASMAGLGGALARGGAREEDELGGGWGNFTLASLR